ncbi:MAG: hypothetical protein HKP30_01875, partial [Myxococcales bacterium]|nr:hypothetical protein [Myxococcales bacterium]
MSPGRASRAGVDRGLEALAAAGVRAFPHPFASQLAFVSDIDSSLRADYEAYRDLLVGRYGLDFGDSCRVQFRTRVDRFPEGLALFGCDGARPPQPPAGWPEVSLTQGEMVHEIHAGNIDHHHFFSGSGPR